MTSAPPEMPEHTRLFVSSLSKDDIDRLAWLLGVVEMVEGWCKVNRYIGKIVIVSILAGLILFSQAMEAVGKLIGAIFRGLGKS